MKNFRGLKNQNMNSKHVSCLLCKRTLSKKKKNLARFPLFWQIFSLLCPSAPKTKFWFVCNQYPTSRSILKCCWYLTTNEENVHNLWWQTLYLHASEALEMQKKKKLTKLFVYVAPVLHYRQRFFNGFINYANLQQQESSSSSLSSKECHTLKQKAQENFPNFLTINLHIKIFGNYLSDLRGA